MQCQLFLSHLFYLIFRGTRCRKIMGRYLISFFAGRGGDGGVCVCVLRGVVSWSDLVVMVDLVRSALRNFGQCGSERPTSCASLWHGLLSDDSFNRKFWQKLPNPFSKKGPFWIHPVLPPSGLLGYLHAHADVKTLHPPLFLAKLGTTAQSSSLPCHHKGWQLAVWSKIFSLSDWDNQ